MDALRIYDGAVVLITGGASGIGAALGKTLAARGASVVLADRQLDLAANVAAFLQAQGKRTEAVELDVRDAAAFDAVVANVAERHGRIDYLFNNAGIGVGGEVRDYTVDDWRNVVDVNLLGVMYGIQAVYGRMIGQGFGHIVNTASMAGLMSAPLATVYCATKHAVVGLSRSLRIEAEPHGVRVSVLCPGVIRTPILEGGRYGRFTKQVSLEAQRVAWEQTRPMNVDAFATQVIDQVARNQAIIVVPRTWRLIWWVNRLSPALFDRFGRIAYQRTKQAFDAALSPK